MNGHWRLRDGSDIFPTSKFTHSLILNQRSNISTTYTIESFSNVLNAGKHDSIRIIRSNNSSINTNNTNEKDRHVTMEYELKTLQYERSKKGDIILSLLESDNKFQQLCFYSYGPDPYERCIEIFKLSLTGYEIKIETHSYRYNEVYTQIRYMIRESVIIANALKIRLNNLRPFDRPTVNSKSSTFHPSLSLQTINSKFSLTETQFLILQCSLNTFHDNKSDNGLDIDNNRNSSGDIYTHIHNISQPYSNNNGLGSLTLAHTSSTLSAVTAGGGGGGGVDITKLSLKIMFTGLIQDVLNSKFKFNNTTATTIPAKPTNQTTNKVIKNNMNGSGGIHDATSSHSTAVATTDLEETLQMKESVQKFLQSHPCDQSVRIYITQVSYESLTWYISHRYNQYYMLNKFIMAHIQDDRAHILQKQHESDTNFQSLLQLSQVNIQSQQSHHHHHQSLRPGTMKTNSSIRSVHSQQQPTTTMTTSTVGALGFYPYNSKKNDDDDDDDDAYSTVTGTGGDDIHNAFFNFPPKRYFNLYGNEDVAYYEQRKDQLQKFVNYLVHKIQLKLNRESIDQQQQQQQQQHISVEQVLLWFFEVPNHLQLQKNLYTDRLLSSLQPPGDNASSSSVHDTSLDGSNSNHHSNNHDRSNGEAASGDKRMTDTCLMVSIPLFVLISATQPNLNGFPVVIQHQIYHLLYQDQHHYNNNSNSSMLANNNSTRDLRMSVGSGSGSTSTISNRNVMNASPPILTKQQQQQHQQSNTNTTKANQQKFGGSTNSSGRLVVYIIEIIYGAVKWVMCHRYHDFYLLYKYIKKELKSIIKHELLLLKTLLKTSSSSSSSITTTSTTATPTPTAVITSTYDQYIQYVKQFPKFPGGKCNILLNLFSSKTQKYENRRLKFQEILTYVIENKSFYSLNIAHSMYAFLSINSHLVSPQLYTMTFKQLIDEASKEKINTLDIFKQQQQLQQLELPSQVFEEQHDVDRQSSSSSSSSRRISFIGLIPTNKNSNTNTNTNNMNHTSSTTDFKDTNKSNNNNNNNSSYDSRSSFANFIQSFKSEKKINTAKNNSASNNNSSSNSAGGKSLSDSIDDDNNNSDDDNNDDDNDDDDNDSIDDEDDNSNSITSNDDNSSILSGCTNATRKSFINAKRLNSRASVNSASSKADNANNNITLSKTNKSNSKINKFLSIFKTENASNTASNKNSVSNSNSNNNVTATTNNNTSNTNTTNNTSSTSISPPPPPPAVTTAPVRLVAPVPSHKMISPRSSLFNFRRPPSISPPIAEHHRDDGNDVDGMPELSSTYATTAATESTLISADMKAAVVSSGTSRTERAKRMLNVS